MHWDWSDTCFWCCALEPAAREEMKEVEVGGEVAVAVVDSPRPSPGPSAAAVGAPIPIARNKLSRASALNDDDEEAAALVVCCVILSG
jgi:hypothetical protein